MAACMTMRVLLVEDEPLIAMMLEDFLEALDKAHAGTAESVGAALSIVERGEFDAAILDVNLRGGEEIAPEHRDRPRLSKPFTMDGVEKALAALG